MTTLRPTAPVTVSRPNGSARQLIAPASVGVLGLLVTFAFSWVPSVWFDEAATISATTRSWPELFRMLGGIDAVHGVYYAAMHVWFDLVGYTPSTLRLPSAAATGLAAALLLVLVRRFASERLAITSAVLFLLLPRVTWMGGEGRSYAVQVVLAIGLTLVFVGAWRRAAQSRRSRLLWWTAYALLATLAIWTFLYLALVIAAHAVTVILNARRDRRSVGLFAAAAAVAGLASIPLLRLADAQSGQVSWILPLDADTLHGVFVAQWFYRNNTFAIAGWILIVIGAVLLLRRHPRYRRAGVGFAAVVLPWLIVPTAGLLVASVLVDPLYSARYVTFSAPAAAVLMAVAATSVRRWWMAAGIVALCAVLTMPSYIAQRTPTAKQSTAWNQVAELVARERAADAPDASEAVIWGPLRKHKAATSRVIEYSYPEAFAGLVDVKLKTPAAQTGTLWETAYPLDQVTERFDGTSVAWLITSDKQDWRPSVAEKLAALGFHVEREWNISTTNVVRYVR
ncbi:glycosyltransferase family 39 protein [Lacisediminihabitans changchengi]|uniref:Glycosyltransferase RgtA/B/C/D-like domain-containing protein n=1 Tax=Lacisediminihabitans changchengi TaxID=2787634 RepID=A0A934SKV1_9MICO|nr:6-pyruvoyl-tetrahydropterin synthase-related protein [Lacisediminihabitans changchengi]MBK4347186.1 hypothetical protein [Lacisediminihabitans changchengi]